MPPVLRNLHPNQEKAFRKMAEAARKRRKRLLDKLPYTFTAMGASTRWDVSLMKTRSVIRAMIQKGEVTYHNAEGSKPRIYRKWD